MLKEQKREEFPKRLETDKKLLKTLKLCPVCGSKEYNLDLDAENETGEVMQIIECSSNKEIARDYFNKPIYCDYFVEGYTFEEAVNNWNNAKDADELLCLMR